MPTWAWVVVAFSAGTIPSPYLIALAAGRGDVIASMRRQESPGDAHFLVSRQISAARGVIAMVLDVVKGLVPSLVAVRVGEPHATVAWTGVAAVAGHSFAPFIRKAGGRGLTTAAGVSLASIPWAMVGTGVISVAGTVARKGGLGTSIGFALLPVFAGVIGYDGALVAMALAVYGLIAIRRLEGIEEDRRAGVPIARAVLGRLLFDLPKGRDR